MNYKLLALDIDDTTTLENTNNPSKSVLDALHKAAKKLTITFVTARTVRQLESFLKEVKLPSGYHVAGNGALVLNPDGSYAYDLHIPDEEIQEIINVTQAYFLEIGFSSDEHWIDSGDPIQHDEHITGLSFTCTSLEQAQLLDQSIKDLPREYATYVTQHWSNKQWTAVLLFHKDATKGKAMGYIQKQLNITPDQTIAVGNASTDLDMFHAAGLKIAMENAEEVLKQEADYICPSIQDDGLAKVIKTYILQ